MWHPFLIESNNIATSEVFHLNEPWNLDNCFVSSFASLTKESKFCTDANILMNLSKLQLDYK